MDDLTCEGCIWECHPEQDNCDSCIRIQDAPFNVDAGMGYVSMSSDNYEGEYPHA